MKKTLNVLIISVLLLFICNNQVFAQIHDIKQNSKENKQNHSSNNSSKDKSSNSNNDNSECIGGCLSAIFSDILSNIFSGCISSIGSGKSDNDNQNNYNPYQSDIDDPSLDLEYSLIQKNKNQADTTNVEEDERLVEITSKITDDGPVLIQNNPVIENQKLDFSFDINANFAAGLEFHSTKTYTYYNFLPGVRANLSWFLIDFRYNILTEFSEDLPDAFKTWGLMFLINVKAGERSNIIFGSGMHKEQYSDMLFNQHYFGVKTVLNEKSDFLDINGRFAVDYKTSEFPFLEFGMHFNKSLTNSDRFSIFFNVGAMYQNYYSATDIWALQAGITFKLH